MQINNDNNNNRDSESMYLYPLRLLLELTGAISKWFSCFSQTNISMHRTRTYSIFKCFCGKDKSVLAKISVIILQCIMYLEQIKKFHKT